MKPETQIELNKQSITVLKEGMHRIEDIVVDIRKDNKEMFNHFTDRYEKIFENTSNRLPKWASYALGFLCLTLGAILQGVIF